MSGSLFETVEYRGCDIAIHWDQDGGDYSNPREWDNLGTMVCFHRRYTLGDDTSHNNPTDFLADILYSVGFRGHSIDNLCLDGLLNLLQTGEQLGELFILPLYLYDHSGLAMSTSRGGWPFNCPWDSGQVGYIYTTREQVLANWPDWKNITKKRRELVYKVLRQEVEIYDSYLRGEIYGFISTDQAGDEIGSCWGFLGDPNDQGGLVDQAKGEINHFLDNMDCESCGVARGFPVEVGGWPFYLCPACHEVESDIYMGASPC